MLDDLSFSDSDDIYKIYSLEKTKETYYKKLHKLLNKNNILSEIKEDGLLSSIDSKQNKPYTKNKTLRNIDNSNSGLKSDVSSSNTVGHKKTKTKKLHKTSLPTHISAVDTVLSPDEVSGGDLNDVVEVVDVFQKVSRSSARLRNKRKRNYNEDSSSEDNSLWDMRGSTNMSNSVKCNSSKKKNKNVKNKCVIGKPTEQVIISDSEESNKSENEEDINPVISVKILWKSTSVKKYHIRRFQKMLVIFQKIAEEEFIPESKILLTFKNCKVTINDTPDSLDLHVYDFIEGGVLNNASNVETTPLEVLTIDNNLVTVKFQNADKNFVKLSLNKDEKFKIAMIKYSEQCEVPLDSVLFFFDGERLDESKTIEFLGLEDNDIVDVKVQKTND